MVFKSSLAPEEWRNVVTAPLNKIKGKRTGLRTVGVLIH